MGTTRRHAGPRGCGAWEFVVRPEETASVSVRWCGACVCIVRSQQRKERARPRCKVRAPAAEARPRGGRIDPRPSPRPEIAGSATRKAIFRATRGSRAVTWPPLALLRWCPACGLGVAAPVHLEEEESGNGPGGFERRYTASRVSLLCISRASGPSSFLAVCGRHVRVGEAGLLIFFNFFSVRRSQPVSLLAVSFWPLLVGLLRGLLDGQRKGLRPSCLAFRPLRFPAAAAVTLGVTKLFKTASL